MSDCILNANIIYKTATSLVTVYAQPYKVNTIRNRISNGQIFVVENSAYTWQIQQVK